MLVATRPHGRRGDTGMSSLRGVPGRATRSLRITLAAAWIALGVALGSCSGLGGPSGPDVAAAQRTQPIAQGQKYVMATHSFNVFIGPPRQRAESEPARPSFAPGSQGPLAALAAERGKQGHEALAVQMIGGSTPMQHWSQGDGDESKNIAKVALRKGGVDVFTLSPNARIPEEGIDRFGDLMIETNPNGRILVQSSWSAWDGNGLTPSVGGTSRPSFTNEDHDKADVATLDGWIERLEAQDGYLERLRTQLGGIDARAGHAMAYVVPSATAVYALRREIVRGTVPGIARQSEIFRDGMGHPLAPLAHLVSYVWYAAMYRESPVGLQALVDAADPTSAPREALLQRLAWNAVVGEPMSGVRGERLPLD
jgi:hypothetical protein